MSCHNPHTQGSHQTVFFPFVFTHEQKYRPQQKHILPQPTHIHASPQFSWYSSLLTGIDITSNLIIFCHSPCTSMLYLSFPCIHLYLRAQISTPTNTYPATAHSHPCLTQLFLVFIFTHEHRYQPQQNNIHPAAISYTHGLPQTRATHDWLVVGRCGSCQRRKRQHSGLVAVQEPRREGCRHGTPGSLHCSHTV